MMIHVCVTFSKMWIAMQARFERANLPRHAYARARRLLYFGRSVANWDRHRGDISANEIATRRNGIATLGSFVGSPCQSTRKFLTTANMIHICLEVVFDRSISSVMSKKQKNHRENENGKEETRGREGGK